METITRLEVSRLKGAPDATHVVLHPDGEIYFCVGAKFLDETAEETFWRERKMTIKKVEG